MLKLKNSGGDFKTITHGNIWREAASPPKLLAQKRSTSDISNGGAITNSVE
jgi:hypothetical protein